MRKLQYLKTHKVNGSTSAQPQRHSSSVGINAFWQWRTNCAKHSSLSLVQLSSSVGDLLIEAMAAKSSDTAFPSIVSEKQLTYINKQSEKMAIDKICILPKCYRTNMTFICSCLENWIRKLIITLKPRRLPVDGYCSKPKIAILQGWRAYFQWNTHTFSWP